MNRANSVHFEGGVDSCRVKSDDDRQTVARLLVYTLHLRPGVGPEVPQWERYQRMDHLVRLTVPSAEAGWVRDLESSMRSDRGRLRPCSVDGPLIFDAEEKANLVECGPAGFKFKERILIYQLFIIL